MRHAEVLPLSYSACDWKLASNRYVSANSTHETDEIEFCKFNDSTQQLLQRSPYKVAPNFKITLRETSVRMAEEPVKRVQKSSGKH